MNERFSGDIMREREDKDVPQPTLDEIGINHFAPYLTNRIATRYNANVAEALKRLDITTTKISWRFLVSLRPPPSTNLRVYTVTRQSTMNRTLDELREQGLIRRVARANATSRSRRRADKLSTASTNNASH